MILSYPLTLEFQKKGLDLVDGFKKSNNWNASVSVTVDLAITSPKAVESFTEDARDVSNCIFH